MKKIFSLLAVAAMAIAANAATEPTTYADEFISGITYKYNGGNSSEVETLQMITVYFQSNSSQFSYLQPVVAYSADAVKVVDAEGNVVASGISFSGEENYVLTAQNISFQGVPAGQYNVVVPAGTFGYQIYNDPARTDEAGSPMYGYNQELTIPVTITVGEEAKNYAYTVDPEDGTELEQLESIKIKFNDFNILMQGTSRVIAIDANGKEYKAPVPTMTMGGNFATLKFEEAITTPGEVVVMIYDGAFKLMTSFSDGSNITNQTIKLTYTIKEAVNPDDAAYEQFAQEYESLSQQWTMVYNTIAAGERTEIVEEYLAVMNGIYQNMQDLETWADDSYNAGTLAQDLDEILGSFEGIQLQLTQCLNAYNAAVEDATGISTISADKAGNMNYDLNGRRVSSAKGFVIMNGKLMLVK